MKPARGAEIFHHQDWRETINLNYVRDAISTGNRPDKVAARILLVDDLKVTVTDKMRIL